MVKSFPLAIAALVAIACICSSAFAESRNSPFIVAHKRVSQKKLSPDLERVSVAIDIYNTGFETAYDVTLTDNSWTKMVFDYVTGNTSKTWDKLDGGSVVTHSFELESKVKTVYQGTPALITFRVLTKAKLQEAYSTPILPLKILSDQPTESKVDMAKRLLTQYSSHLSVALIVILFVRIVITPSKSSAGVKKKKH